MTHSHSRIRIWLVATSVVASMLTAPFLAAAQTAGFETLRPAGVAFRGDDLLVASAGTGELLSISPSGQQITLIGDLIPGTFTRGATGVAVDGNGNAYVALAEDGAVYFATPDGTGGVYASGLGAPNGIAFDDEGNLYVADQAANRILQVNPARDVSVFADEFAEAPFGLALGADGDLYVSTLRDGKVWAVDGTGSVTEFAETGSSAEGLAFDMAGNLYVGAGSVGEVLRISPTGAAATVAAGVAGPVNLAFHGGTLLVAAQGEGTGGIGNEVIPLSVGETGLPLAAPALTTTSLSEAPPHSVAHLAGGVAVDPAPFAEILPQGAATDVGRDAAEPTIGVTESGNVFYAASTFDATPAGGLARTEILRSTDRGLTWEEVTPGLPEQDVTIPPTTLDPYLYVDPETSRVFTIDLYVGCSYLWFSDDEGETWVPNPIACGIPVNDHQTIGAGPTSLPTIGYPNALYYCYNAFGPYGACGRSLDGGVSFHPAGVTFPPLTSGCTGLTGHVAVGPEGTVYLPNAQCNSGPQVAVSHDDGANWTQVQVTQGMAGSHHEAAVAVDTAGNAYYLWVAGADRLPYLSISRDSGATWSEPVMVGPPGLTEANLPTIAAGDEGKIAIYYMGTPGDCCYDKKYSGETMWNTYVSVSVNALDEGPTLLTTTMNDPRDPLRRGTCGPGRCGNAFDFFEVVIDHDGRTWASLTDTCTGNCAKPGLTGTNNDGQGFAGQLVRGPKLRGGEGLLAPPPWFGADVSAAHTSSGAGHLQLPR